MVSLDAYERLHAEHLRCAAAGTSFANSRPRKHKLQSKLDFSYKLATQPVLRHPTLSPLSKMLTELVLEGGLEVTHFGSSWTPTEVRLERRHYVYTLYYSKSNMLCRTKERSIVFKTGTKVESNDVKSTICITSRVAHGLWRQKVCFRVADTRQYLLWKDAMRHAQRPAVVLTPRAKGFGDNEMLGETSSSTDEANDRPTARRGDMSFLFVSMCEEPKRSTVTAMESFEAIERSRRIHDVRERIVPDPTVVTQSEAPTTAWNVMQAEHVRNQLQAVLKKKATPCSAYQTKIDVVLEGTDTVKESDLVGLGASGCPVAIAEAIYQKPMSEVDEEEAKRLRNLVRKGMRMSQAVLDYFGEAEHWPHPKKSARVDNNDKTACEFAFCRVLQQCAVLFGRRVYGVHQLPGSENCELLMFKPKIHVLSDGTSVERVQGGNLSAREWFKAMRSDPNVTKRPPIILHYQDGQYAPLIFHDLTWVE